MSLRVDDFEDPIDNMKTVMGINDALSKIKEFWNYCVNEIFTVIILNGFEDLSDNISKRLGKTNSLINNNPPVMSNVAPAIELFRRKLKFQLLIIDRLIYKVKKHAKSGEAADIKRSVKKTLITILAFLDNLKNGFSYRLL
jgi:hypothetical protein